MMRWGIAGTGRIAGAFAETIAAMDGHVVAAVSSSDSERAAGFASRHGIARSCGSHAALPATGDVDAVYVATTNDRHFTDALACIDAGIAVLCEKPLTLDSRSADQLMRAARSAGVFLMEAMWTRFLPSTVRVLELIAGGAIGDVQSVHADFGFPATLVAGGRLLDRSLGGGALLDIGIYPLSLIHLVAGAPTETRAVAVLAETGVDLQVSVASLHGNVVSSASASFLADSSLEAVISGSTGRIRMHKPFHHTERLTIEGRDAAIETIDLPLGGSGYRFEAAEVAHCLSAGSIESPRRPHADTLAVARWMDEVRAQIGVRYEGLPPA